jgi:hypothetical protein
VNRCCVGDKFEMISLSRRSLLGGSTVLLCAAAMPESLRRGVPPLVFISNPLADYLQLLFFRLLRDTYPPFSPPGFDQAPRLHSLVSVPEAVASAGLTRYEQVRPFVAKAFAALPTARIGPPHPKILSYSASPPALYEVLRVVEAGRPFFPTFLDYWRQSVRPKIEAQIAGWREQDARFHPLAMLVDLQRLPLRAPRLQVVAMPFHPSGSGNYSPAAIYSSLFDKPNLCWFLGHEGSHLIWSAAVGTPPERIPGAAALLQAAKAQKLDVEETMCLFMQVQLSKACGATKAGFRLSSQLPDGLQKKLMVALEENWDGYRTDAARWPNLQTYVLEKARAVIA